MFWKGAQQVKLGPHGVDRLHTAAPHLKKETASKLSCLLRGFCEWGERRRPGVHLRLAPQSRPEYHPSQFLDLARTLHWSLENVPKTLPLTKMHVGQFEGDTSEQQTQQYWTKRAGIFDSMVVQGMYVHSHWLVTFTRLAPTHPYLRTVSTGACLWRTPADAPGASTTDAKLQRGRAFTAAYRFQLNISNWLCYYGSSLRRHRGARAEWFEQKIMSREAAIYCHVTG